MVQKFNGDRSGSFAMYAGAAVTMIAVTIVLQKKRTADSTAKLRCSGTDYESLIGNTPLIHLKKLSAHLSKKKKSHKGDGDKRIQNATNIYVKMESMNPGGTGKDRAALFMLRDAEKRGLLPPPITSTSSTSIEDESKYRIGNRKQAEERNLHINDDAEMSDTKNSASPDVSSTINVAIKRSKTGGIVVEGTSGSTGISLATLAAQRGHSTIIVMPDDQAQEKMTILRCLGAVLHVVPTAAISNPNHYVNVARKIAKEINDKSSERSIKCRGKMIQAAFMNQFENEANYNAHISTTGPEIWRQTRGKIDTFCMSSGTGGTISGVGQYLKDRCGSDGCKIVLIDPPGSALFNKIKYNIAYASEQMERGLLRHRYDTIAEGIGLDRVTRNFALGTDNNVMDDAVRVTDQEAVDMAHWLLKEEGLFVGSSSAMNVCGAIKVALSSPSSSCIVTVICDGGQRHLTRFWNKEFIKNWGLFWPEDDKDAWINRLPMDIIVP